MQKLRPCLWFDTEGEEAAKLYTSIFPNSGSRTSRTTARRDRGTPEPC